MNNNSLYVCALETMRAEGEKKITLADARVKDAFLKAFHFDHGLLCRVLLKFIYFSSFIYGGGFYTFNF